MTRRTWNHPSAANPAPEPGLLRRFFVRRTSAGVVWLLSIALLWLGTGCRTTPQLMPTPNVYLNRLTNAFANVPPALRSNVVDVLYVTDREAQVDGQGQLRYGRGRSPSLAYGQSRISLGDGMSWGALCTESRAAHRRHSIPVRLLGLRELGRFPDTPMLVVADGEGSEPSVDPAAALARMQARLQAEIQRRLELTPRKDVIVFVHGFNLTFERATALTAQLWHFLEREGVPIAYTWPAGRGGLRGYSYDRESGEFTLFHLKQFLRTLLDCPGIQRIHLVAHSRGTDILTTALRELVIESGGPTRDAVRLDRVANVVLLAPDLDAQVAGQRLVAEHIEQAVERTTIYVCSEDRAITLANWLFEGVRRLGVLRASDFTEKQRAFLRTCHNVHFVDARVRAGFLSHGYFYRNPAVSSDLVILLRENCAPGTPDCRPLDGDGDPFWRVTEGYPHH